MGATRAPTFVMYKLLRTVYAWSEGSMVSDRRNARSMYTSAIVNTSVVTKHVCVTLRRKVATPSLSDHTSGIAGEVNTTERLLMHSVIIAEK